MQHIAAELSTGDQGVLETLYFALDPLPPSLNVNSTSTPHPQTAHKHGLGHYMMSYMRYMYQNLPLS